jgi:hypothetical protein|tara:strand:+ start:180 stop:449 length:270 start_codon:yes stop_codon:yes gene_type:complete
MKLFVYKSLFVFILVLILFKLTFGKIINDFEKKIYYLSSQQNIITIKEKIRQELQGIDGEKRLLSEEDAKLINRFLNKIKNELSATENK